MKLKIWKRKFLTKKTQIAAKESVTFLGYRKLKRHLKPLKENNFYNFLRFTSSQVSGVSKNNGSEDNVYEAFSNDYMDMTVRKKLCEKSLIAILQTINQEDEEETYEQMNLVNSRSSPCEDDIYECLDL